MVNFLVPFLPKIERLFVVEDGPYVVGVGSVRSKGSLGVCKRTNRNSVCHPKNGVLTLASHEIGVRYLLPCNRKNPSIYGNREYNPCCDF